MRRSKRLRHPERVHDRKSFLASLVPAVELLDEDARAEQEDDTVTRQLRPAVGTGPGDPYPRPWRRICASYGHVNQHRRLAATSAGTYSEFVERLQALRCRRVLALPGPGLPAQPPGAW